jgi:hypothetical protein
MEFETTIFSHNKEQTGCSESENIWSHSQPDTLLADNFFNDRRGKTLFLPEHRLMLAILEDAVACFQNFWAAEHGERKRVFNDVQKWFFAASTGWIFDFEIICSIVGFDPNYFRSGLLDWMKNELSKTRSAPPPAVTLS